MNKYMLLSVLMATCSLIFFFTFRGPGANIELGVAILAVFSIIGFSSSYFSAKLRYVITGCALNAIVVVYTAIVLVETGINA